jgi:hypothetical protein
MTLERQLREEFTGSEIEGYRAYMLVEVRIKDHSCNYGNNYGRVVSFVTEENDPTAHKFISENINISNLSFEEAKALIKDELFKAAKEEILDCEYDYDKAETIVNLYDYNIIDEEQVQELYKVSKLEDESEIERVLELL